MRLITFPNDIDGGTFAGFLIGSVLPGVPAGQSLDMLGELHAFYRATCNRGRSTYMLGDAAHELLVRALGVTEAKTDLAVKFWPFIAAIREAHAVDDTP